MSTIINTFRAKGGNTVTTAGSATVISALPTTLSVTKTPSATSIIIGEYLTYTIEVTNTGLANPATDVFFTDPLPSQLQYSSSSTTQGSTMYNSATATVAGSLGEIAPGATVVVKIVTLVVG